MASAISQNVLGLATSTSPGLAQAGGYNILPAGIVFPYAGGTAPTGFLICDGQQLSKETYDALFAAIGDDYATQIDPTTGSAYAAPDEGFFRLPDYRGLFLRGAGTPSGLDTVTRGALQGDKTKKNGLNATAADSSISGTAAGQSQATSNVSLASGSAASGGINHSHSINSYKNGSDVGIHVIAATGSTINFSSSAGTNTASAYNHTHSVSGTTNIGHTHGSSSVSGTSTAQAITVGDGDTETRPINKGVNYIIKA
jgi:microcystin-dependent protein